MSRRVFTFAVSALVCALLLACGLRAAAEEPARQEGARHINSTTAPTSSMPLKTPEELFYEGEFSRLVIRGLKIAEFHFTAKRGELAASAAGAPPDAANASSAALKAAPAPMIITGEVHSRGLFQKLFGINFHYRVESLVEPESFNVLRTTKLDAQGKRVRTSEAIFDRIENRISWTERDPNDPQRAPRVVHAPLDGASHDLITAIYFLRTQKLTPGQSFELVMSDSGVVYRLPVRVFAEKKRIKSVVGKVPVVRLEIEMFGEGRLVKAKGQMSLWITDDARRLPIRARISSEPGTIDIKLKKVSPPNSRS